jgi:hypothetical protein
MIDWPLMAFVVLYVLWIGSMFGYVVGKHRR